MAGWEYGLYNLGLPDSLGDDNTATTTSSYLIGDENNPYNCCMLFVLSRKLNSRSTIAGTKEKHNSVIMIQNKFTTNLL